MAIALVELCASFQSAQPFRAAFSMGTRDRKNRQIFRWCKEARDLVKAYLRRKDGIILTQIDKPRDLVTALVRITGNPRDACWRFSRQLGLLVKQTYRGWTPSEEQKLLDLIALNPPAEVARLMRRSEKSIRAKLHKLGANANMGDDWFTASTLAKALHIRADEVRRWIEQGWLHTRNVQIGSSQRTIIDADAFAEFCKEHRKQVVGNRLTPERLDFVQNFVFPTSHAPLLPVRERGYKKRNKSTGDDALAVEMAVEGQKRPAESDFLGDESESDIDDDVMISA